MYSVYSTEEMSYMKTAKSITRNSFFFKEEYKNTSSLKSTEKYQYSAWLKKKKKKQYSLIYVIYIYKKRVNRVIATFPFSRVISSVKRVLVTQLELARAKIS